jgi:hypothetical protein
MSEVKSAGSTGAKRDLRWQVRITDAGGKALGAGCLLDENHVLTCAHVVGTGTRDRGLVQRTGLRAEFHQAEHQPPVGMRVLADAWVPPLADERGDVAVLKLDHPVRAIPGVPLVRNWSEDLRVRLCGHPAGTEGFGGIWVSGRTVAEGGPGGEWVQLKIDDGDQAEHGHSGAAVLTEDGGEAVGLLVSVDKKPGSRAAWMIPVRTVVRYLRMIDRYVVGDPSTDRAFTKHISLPLDSPMQVELSRALVDWLGPDQPGGVCVLAGPGSGALLGRLAALSDQARLGQASAQAPQESPAGTLPAPGVIDVAVEAAGKDYDAVAGQITDVLHLRTGGGQGLADQLTRHGPLVVMISQADLALDPGALRSRLLEPLADRAAGRGVKVLIGFHGSPPPSLARALAGVVGAARHLPGARPQDGPEPPAVRAADVSALLNALAADEEEARRRHAEVSREIFGVKRPPHGVAPALRVRLATAAALSDDRGFAHWAQGELHACQADAQRADKRARSAVAGLGEKVRRRDELRRQIRALHARELGDHSARAAENDTLGLLYTAARELLYLAPCYLAEAEKAVAEYAYALRRR